MKLCQCSSKLFLVVLGAVFWAIAAGLIFIGAWVYSNFNDYSKIASEVYTLVPASILMGAGVFIFLLGIVGCVGAVKEQKCLLGLFFTILLIILCGMVVAAVLGYVYRGDVNTTVNKAMKEALHKYGQNDTESHLWTTEVDFIQSNFSCCGIDGPGDWKNTTWYKSKPKNESNELYPNSCCAGFQCNYTHPDHGNHTNNPYSDGCYNHLREQFLSHLAVVAGVGVAFAVIIVLGMMGACFLICRKRDDVPYIGLNEPQGMRV